MPPKFSVITPTHNPSWLKSTWASLRAQEGPSWEWVVSVNRPVDRWAASLTISLEDQIRKVKSIVGDDPRVRVIGDTEAEKEEVWRVGALKRFAFMQGEGDYLVELDHDDLLLPGALAEMAAVFDNWPDIGFVYSDFADFQEGSEIPQGIPPTYMTRNEHESWKRNGFQFYREGIAAIPGVNDYIPGQYVCVRSFPPTATSMSLIFWSPNHVRAWRASVYRELGGHDPKLRVCDDHDLLCRTYLVTRMHHIPKPLYLYRVSGKNTWSANQLEIDGTTRLLQAKYLERLTIRQAELAGLPVYDLGGAFAGGRNIAWAPVDIDPEVRNHPRGIHANLTKPWPFEDSSVGAFRAVDFLEHLPDKMHTMREIWRCLAPGGMLLSMTPSTDGRGAFQDPTHTSFWNSNAFWYWTRKEQAQYIRNHRVRFMPLNVYDTFPTPWHKDHNILYTIANLVCLKGGEQNIPGEKFI